MTDGCTPQEIESLNELLEKVSFLLGEPPSSGKKLEIVVEMLHTLEKLSWNKAAHSKFEYGQLYHGGGHLILVDTAETQSIYSIAQQIAHGRQHGGQVDRRCIIVLEDWRPVDSSGAPISSRQGRR
jgi:hypothetical protein